MMEKKAFIFGGLFALANRLQVLGDKLDTNITIKQWLFIAVISKLEQSPTITEVASMIGNSRQNVKRMASSLQQQGFINLTKDSFDARIIRVELTEKCRGYFKQREAEEDQFLAQLFDQFDANMLTGLYNGLIKLMENVEQMEHLNE